MTFEILATNLKSFATTNWAMPAQRNILSMILSVLSIWTVLNRQKIKSQRHLFDSNCLKNKLRTQPLARLHGSSLTIDCARVHFWWNLWFECCSRILSYFNFLFPKWISKRFIFIFMYFCRFKSRTLFSYLVIYFCLSTFFSRSCIICVPCPLANSRWTQPLQTVVSRKTDGCISTKLISYQIVKE